MNIIFYNNKSNHNVINKQLEVVKSISIKLKDDTPMLYPKLYLKGYTGGNYCFIPTLKRYYFIDNISLLKGELYEINLSIDVLMSYKEDIANADFYADSGVITTVDNDINFMEDIYDSNKFLIMIGG